MYFAFLNGNIAPIIYWLKCLLKTLCRLIPAGPELDVDISCLPKRTSMLAGSSLSSGTDSGVEHTYGVVQIWSCRMRCLNPVALGSGKAGSLLPKGIYQPPGACWLLQISSREPSRQGERSQGMSRLSLARQRQHSPHGSHKASVAECYPRHVDQLLSAPIEHRLSILHSPTSQSTSWQSPARMWRHFRLLQQAYWYRVSAALAQIIHLQY